MKGTGAKAPAERSRALCGEVVLMVGRRERRLRASSAALGRKSARQGIGEASFGGAARVGETESEVAGAAKECAVCAGVRAAWGQAWSYGCGEKHRCCSAHVPATTGVVVVAVMTGALAGAR